ncbi:hypothetical protein GCM10023339_74360 [Alloalcanivorax gelatiniphagus]
MAPVLVLLGALLAGCSDEGDGGDAGSAGSDGTGGTPSPTASASVRVPEPTPVVEPADGPRIRTEGATIRGLKGMRLVSDYGVLQGYRNDQAHLTFLPGYAGDASLDKFARVHEKIVEEDEGDILERVDDVVVGGEYNAFHFLDTSEKTEENHVYGLIFLNGSWTIHIGFYDEEVKPGVPPLTAEEREEATARILASFEPTFN